MGKAILTTIDRPGWGPVYVTTDHDTGAVYLSFDPDKPMIRLDEHSAGKVVSVYIGREGAGVVDVDAVSGGIGGRRRTVFEHPPGGGA